MGIMVLLDLLEPLGHNGKFQESINTYEKHKHIYININIFLNCKIKYNRLGPIGEKIIISKVSFKCDDLP